MKPRKTPQEKKALSYNKDRRNAYGESPHGARKAIPENKKRVNEEYRRKIRQAINPNVNFDPDEIDSAVKGVKNGIWKKMADQPLKVVLGRKKARRAKNEGRKAKAKVQRLISQEKSEIEFSELKTNLVKQLNSGKVDQITNAILTLTMSFPTWEGPQTVCVILAQNKDPRIRGLAILGLGHIARVHKTLEKKTGIAAIKLGLKDKDESVRGQAENARDDVKLYLGWEI